MQVSGDANIDCNEIAERDARSRVNLNGPGLTIFLFW